MSNPTTLPLAQRITPGPYKQGTRGPDACPIVGTINGTMICKLAHSTHHDDQADQAEANAALILEAFQTTADTGRTPRQFADGVGELFWFLTRLQSAIPAVLQRECLDTYVEELIEKFKPCSQPPTQTL